MIMNNMNQANEHALSSQVQSTLPVGTVATVSAPGGIEGEGVSRIVENEVEQPSIVAFPTPLDLRGEAMTAASPASVATSRDQLGDFLSRPIKIGSIDTSVGTPQVWYPWQVLLTDPEVVRKMRAFHLFRGTLCIRFVMSVSQFVQGRVFAGYNPEVTRNVPVFNRTDYRAISHLPFSASLDPGLGNDVMWRIPYHFASPYWEVGSPEPMAEIRAKTLILFDNASTGTVTNTPISILAWFEDVELKVSVVPQAVGPQAGKAAVGSAVHKAIDATAQLVGTATSASVHSALGAAAALAGFTRELITAAQSPVRLRTSGGLAITDGPDNAYALTAEPDVQKLIATDVAVGVKEDELSIVYMASRFSYLTTTSWASTDPPGTPLDTRYVFPYSAIDTCVGFACAPFAYWRGSMRFRLSAVRTPFHKGKLLVKWSPTNVLSPDLNTGYSTVWDLDSTPEIEIHVPYNQSNYFLHHTQYNGRLALYVMEPLTGPADNASVPIVCYVAGGSDLEVTSPDVTRLFPTPLPHIPTPGSPTLISEIDPNLSPVQPQSGVENIFVLGPSSSAPDAAARSMGEVVYSARELMKRRQLAITFPGSENRFVPTYPVSHDWVWWPRALGSDETSSPYWPTYMTWYMMAFLGINGSTRWDFSTSNNGGSMFLFRSFGVVGHQIGGLDIMEGLSSGAAFVRSSIDGMSSIVSPHYIDRQFSYSEELYNQAYYAHQVLGNRDRLANGFYVSGAGTGETTGFVSSGDDFNLLYYLGPPALS